MPVPKSSVPAEPRTLLRDVVYAKLASAIEDGTLVPGERLNDNELTEWLDVSRTPVREAISRLVSEGLVEMAANRYTRVSTASAKDYKEAAELLAALHAGVGTRNDHFDESAVKTAKADIEKLRAGLEAHDLSAYRSLQDALGSIIASTGNQLYSDTERAVRGRVKFHAAADDIEIDWDGALVQADRIARPQ
jgi:DNA-binding GntR family transcriptional regulator